MQDSEKYCKNMLKKFQKMCTTESCLPVKRFLISRKNLVTKITTYIREVVMRSITKSQEFSGVINLPPPPPLVMIW